MVLSLGFIPSCVKYFIGNSFNLAFIPFKRKELYFIISIMNYFTWYSSIFFKPLIKSITVIRFFPAICNSTTSSNES